MCRGQSEGDAEGEALAKGRPRARSLGDWRDTGLELGTVALGQEARPLGGVTGVNA